MDKLKKAHEVALNTIAKMEQMEQNVQAALKQLKDIAQTPTFAIEGVYYQVRERGGSLYLCKLQGKPLGRPKGTASSSAPKRGKKKAAETVEADDVTETDDSDAVEAAVEA